MAFNLRSFLRQISSDTVRTYVDARQLDWPEDFDWLDSSKKLLEQMVGVMSVQPAWVERELHQVDILADPVGQEVLGNLIWGRKDLTFEIERQPDQRARALALLLSDSKLFARALEAFAIQRQRGGRSWSGYNVRANEPCLIDQPSTSKLEAALADLFAKSGGRRPRIVIETQQRIEPSPNTKSTSRVSHFAVYVEGDVENRLVFGDGGVENDYSRPAIVAGIIHDEANGELGVMARGGKPMRERICAIFCNVALGQRDAQPIVPREIDLSPLKRSQAFPLDPSDPIKAVWLDVLELHHAAASAPRVTIKRPPGRGAPPSDWLRRRCAFGTPEQLLRHPMTIVHAVDICVQFHPAPGEQETKTHRVTLTCPNKCNLRDQTERERLIIQKYLSLWGLLRDVTPLGRAAE